MTTSKTALRTNSVIRNWIAGLALASMLIGTSVAAYVGLNGRVVRLEESKDILLQIRTSVDKMQEDITEMRAELAAARAERAAIKEEMRRNNNFDY